MKILRLFVGNDLNQPVNWLILNEDDSHETGSSVIADLATIEHVTLEIYLSIACCSIVKTDLHGISGKKLTEELVLGLIEDNLVDDISEVKPIILHSQDTEQDTVYVAVFNREYYIALINAITALNKPIRFIQSFAFATVLAENAWTVFLSKASCFVRTNKFEFYALDNNSPVPHALVDLLNNNKPEKLLIYTDGLTFAEIKENLAEPLGISCSNVSEQFNYGVPVWNFYNPKSSSLKIKLSHDAKQDLWQLYKLGKYLCIFLFIYWLFNVIQLNISNHNLANKIKTSLKQIVPTQHISRTILENAATSIKDMRHDRALYDDSDAIILFNKFLEIASTINHNNIQQIKYRDGVLRIILGNDFDTSNFTNYANILATRHIRASIVDFASYTKGLKTSNSNNNDLLDSSDDKLVGNPSWVITLQPELISSAHFNDN